MITLSEHEILLREKPKSANLSAITDELRRISFISSIHYSLTGLE